MKPVLFVTGHVPADRAGAFELLHERAGGIELALFGGRHQHGAPAAPPPEASPTAPSRSARSARSSPTATTER